MALDCQNKFTYKAFHRRRICYFIFAALILILLLFLFLPKKLVKSGQFQLLSVKIYTDGWKSTDLSFTDTQAQRVEALLRQVYVRRSAGSPVMRDGDVSIQVTFAVDGRLSRLYLGKNSCAYPCGGSSYWGRHVFVSPAPDLLLTDLRAILTEDTNQQADRALTAAA